MRVVNFGPHKKFKWRGFWVRLPSVLVFEIVREREPSACARHDGKGLTMKRLIFAAAAALTVVAAPALAADMPVKARAVAVQQPPAWDIAFGSSLASDYVFRGITQSNGRPSVSAYFEPRYNVNKDLQLYFGTAGSSISFPNRAAAEIDFYGGIRPTLGKLAFDIGAVYYWYPGGQCFNGGVPGDCAANGFLPVNGNVIKSDLSFWEVFGKATYTVTDAFTVAAAVFYSPSVLNSGADGVFVGGQAKYTFPAFANGVQFYTSGEIGHWDIGTSDAFYAVPAFPTGLPYASYTTWNLGVGWTWKVFTVDLRYYDTDLSRGDCNAFTSDHTARFDNSFTAINPGGFGSGWCSARFVAKLGADLTLNTNVK
jgi:hypothetical protein